MLISCYDVAGMKDQQQIRFAQEGDQQPDIEPGDVVVVLDEQEHDVFKRRKTDLFMDMQIGLAEAVCGMHRSITTLDNRVLVISTLPGLLVHLLQNACTYQH
jgi:DnaJ-class molecular chaperone